MNCSSWGALFKWSRYLEIQTQQYKLILLDYISVGTTVWCNEAAGDVDCK